MIQHFARRFSSFLCYFELYIYIPCIHIACPTYSLEHLRSSCCNKMRKSLVFFFFFFFPYFHLLSCSPSRFWHANCVYARRRRRKRRRVFYYDYDCFSLSSLAFTLSQTHVFLSPNLM